MRNVRKFDTRANYDNYNLSDDWITPNISFISEDNIYMINRYEPPVRALQFTLTENSAPGTIKFRIDENLDTTDFEYAEFSIDGENWTRVNNINNTQVDIESSILYPGDFVFFRGKGICTCRSLFIFSSGLKAICRGSIMSLIDKLDTDALQGSMQGLFKNCQGLISPPKLPATTIFHDCYNDMFNGCINLIIAPVLPATTLESGCYASMFNGCTSLTAAPALPATTLAIACYMQMFYHCSSLTTMPELPATVLAEYCYDEMFSFCTSLTNSKPLRATTLVQYCYNEMFNSCTNLNYIKCLATNISASNCLTNWVRNVSNTGLFIKNNSMEDWTTGVSGIPTGWTVANETNTISVSESNYVITASASSNVASDIVVTLSSDDQLTITIPSGQSSNSITITRPTSDITYNLSVSISSDDIYNYSLNSNTLFISAIVDNQIDITTTTDTITATATNSVTSNVTITLSGDISETIIIASGQTVGSISVSPSATNRTCSLSVSPSNDYTYNYVFGSNSVTIPAVQTNTITVTANTNSITATANNNVASTITITLSGDISDTITIASGQNSGSINNISPSITSRTCSLSISTSIDSTYNYVLYSNIVTIPAVQTNTITVTATDDTITANATNSVTSNVTITLSGDISDTITIASGQNSGFININTSNTSRTCNLSISISIDSTYNYVLYSNSVTIPVLNYETHYLTIVSTSDNNTIRWKASESYIIKTISVSTDNGHTWTDITSIINGATLATLNTGNKLLIKGSNTTYSTGSFNNYFTSTGQFNVEGNIMSMIYGDNFISRTTLSLSSNYAFRCLFYDSKVVDASNLILPATTLADYCYQSMFQYCTSLTTAPVLPATTLVLGCYYSMFRGCTSLTTAPELHATTLATNCYYYMFQGCTNLNYIKCLATNIPATNCTSNWVKNVAASGTFVKDSSMTSWTTGTNGIPSGWTVEDYNINNEKYLTIVSTSDNNTIGWKTSNASVAKTISVSTNNGSTWTDKTSSTDGVTLATLNTGDKLLIKGSNTTYGTSSYRNSFTSTGQFNVEGNIMSLIYGDNFIGQTTLSETNTFKSLFINCSNVVDASNLILPATTLPDYCYQNMFYGCTNLTTTPVLPATTLAFCCYNNMFNGCTSLTTAPVLPATTLASECYSSMFFRCSSLTTAPALPATTLADYCYNNMFNGCTSLTTAPVLPSTTLTQYCYSSMFNGCTSLTTAPVLPATTLAKSCYNGMFSGCNSLTTAPALPATTLADYCYYEMFKNCTSLTTAPALPATTLTQGCYYGMFTGCTNLNYIKCLTTNISANYCTTDWVKNVAASGTFVKDPSMTGWTTGNNGIPSGWTVQDYNVNNEKYLTIVSTSDNNTIGWQATNASVAKTISVSTDNGQTWIDKVSSTSGVELAMLNEGEKLLIKGNNSNYGAVISYGYEGNKFVSTGTFDVEGNIMSLIYGDDFYNKITLSDSCNFIKLFNESKVVNANNLILPATTLTSECYANMFKNCTNLITTPKLPATLLQYSCYSGMFIGCTSLITAPVLPATTLASNCYANMFSDCTSLTTAPVLPVTTLAGNCYGSMFKNCSSLTTAPVLPATTLANSCYQYMFYGCVSLTTAPDLLASQLEDACYYCMFSGCTNLNYIKCLATKKRTGAIMCTSNWVTNVASLGTFVKSATMAGWTWSRDEHGIPADWTVENYNINIEKYLTIVSTSNNNTIGWKASSKSLTKTISISTDNGSTWTNKTSSTNGVTLATLNNGGKLLIKGSNTAYGTSSYFNYFTSSGQFNVEGNIMSMIYGDNFIGQTTLSSTYTFAYLFDNSKVVDASNLILPATTLAEYCYISMFRACTSLSTAPELRATTLATACYINMFNDCTSLTIAPELPATMLAQYCYQDMFYGCINLTTAPVLPATTLVLGCYAYMFRACTSLSTAPELPATTLTQGCYYYMFQGCTNLNYIKCLATDISATDCTTDWVDGVAISGTFIKDPYMTGWTTGNNGIPSGWTVVNAVIDYSTRYLTFVSTSDNNTIGWKVNNASIAKTISISTDNGSTWTQKTSDTSGVTLATLNTGDKLLIKGSNATYGKSSYYNYFTSTNTFDAQGNIMSMIYGDNFIGQTTLSSNFTFIYLFKSSNVVNASNFILPATTLANSCYYSMFSSCISLTTAPILPATTLADGCYNQMFNNCRSLTTAPALPATTLAYSCYSHMFHGCTSITTAPNTLPATTLADSCYFSMFFGCTSLTTAPVLPATTLVQDCYAGMFSGCTSLTTAPILPATMLVNYCYRYMFKDCTSLTTAPELPATTLTQNCYYEMFRGCANLNYIKCLATDISATDCTTNWVQNVAASGTFIKDSTMTNWTTGTSGIPSGWTVEDCINHNTQYLTIVSTTDNNTIKWVTYDASLKMTISVSTDNGQTWTNKTSNQSGVTLATLNTGGELLIKGSNTAYGNSSYYNWFTSSGQFNVEGNIMSMIYGDNFIGQTTLSETYTFYRLFNSSKVVDASNLILPATTLAANCYSSMFNNCTALTTAPAILRATTLAYYCYSGMFQGCTNLTTAPTILPATTLAQGCYSNMFNNCTALTITPALPATTLANYCYSGMFQGCTNLTTAPALPATTLAQYCYYYMFRGCTSLTTVPELPATTLASDCYGYMFNDCTNLNYIKCLATNISASSCLSSWVNGVAASGTFVKDPSMTGWTTGNNGIPSGWIVENYQAAA